MTSSENICWCEEAFGKLRWIKAVTGDTTIAFNCYVKKLCSVPFNLRAYRADICGESVLLIVCASSHNTIYLLSKAETN